MYAMREFPTRETLIYASDILGKMSIEERDERLSVLKERAHCLFIGPESNSGERLLDQLSDKTHGFNFHDRRSPRGRKC